MAIRVALNHKTQHRYARNVWLSPQVVRLRPAPHCRTPILSYSLTVKPNDHFTNWQQDPYNNYLARLVFPKQTREFSVEVDLIADMTVINPFDFFLEAHAEQCPFEYGPVLQSELSPYLVKAPADAKLSALVAEFSSKKDKTVDYLVALNQRLANMVKYVIRLEPGVQEPEHTLTCLSGSCRDSAWLLVQVLRHLGLAARFVSGYLIQLIPDIKPLEGPVGSSQDFTDLHAWTEVYLPGAGWVGLDPTSGLFTGEGHIPLACSAEPSSAAAISGNFSVDNADIVTANPDVPAEANHEKDEFHFSMSITRVHEESRVTKPYTEAQWEQINAVGRQVDAQLTAGDVRLTMGGEPTFVGTEDVNAKEWNGEAVGPRKLEIGDELIKRLRERFAPGGFLHHGQGKWYPGESLPRWALGLYWRKDGQPIWKDAALVAQPGKTKPASEDDARLFITHLAWRLGVDARNAQPGYEDAWWHIWKENRLPVNVDPFDSNLADEEMRRRLARVFNRGLQTTVGYCLPLARRDEAGVWSWVSTPWFFRPQRMYLVPGDSPMGYRLPLESLPWVAPEDFPDMSQRDPMESRSALPASESLPVPPAARIHTPPPELAPLPEDRELEVVHAPLPSFVTATAPAGPVQLTIAGAVEPETLRGIVMQKLERDDEHPGYAMPARGESARHTVRTALCTEVRDGAMRVFMPPLKYVEDYLDLVAAIEETAAALKIPVLVEGYTPPFDPRIAEMKVTPDPGVIEVNTQPAHNWDELVQNTLILDEEARRCRLGTEKFQLDGRHTGTGGGNHIVMGGDTPADSPILRRPHLLKSLLGYWHNHPALSYLFSSVFIGPTSQAPRVDEARNDQVHELELAFTQVPDHGNVPPWLVDRIFRNLLIDSTGNTHRAEFCIDKLYAPESPTGRLGLLEMRGFEMPPHPRMSLTQHLLLRALIATFWKKPYNRPLVRWRTEIHDRFMLPHYVKQDLADVIFDLNEGGFPIKLEWFTPHIDFRFPVLGEIQQRGVQLELRQAIEPWHVLGEVPGISSTVRYVDSSLERLQVRVDGMTDTRHRIAVNGVAIPMHPTGVNGQFVSGVRYRAWHPASCLQPTIGVHAPLTFDVYDTWTGRSIGGCQYHVSHPGGRSFDRFPVNAYEAESRRVARFFKFGHTPGPLHLRETGENKEFPYTLDLRWYLA